MVQWRLSMRVTSFPPPPEELDIQHDVHAGLEDNLCVGEVVICYRTPNHL